jgi:hypothetical protein
MAAIDLSKFRVPLGALAVDASLVVALVWWGAQMTERFDQMSRRLETVEQQRIQPDADRRLAVLESAAVADARWRERIEQKIDQLLVTRK